MPPTPNRPLQYLNPGWFSMVMGLCGLALAWNAATPLLGPMAAGVALVMAGVALVLFVVLAAASLWRWQRHPQALADDLKHPVRHAFVAAVPVSLLLLASVGQALGLNGRALELTWLSGCLLQLWATVWVLGRWLAPQASPATSPWPAITPALFIAVVGNVLAPLAGTSLGYGFWASAQLGIGAVFWPVVLTLLLVRRLAHGPLPDRLLPTWFITIAPPAVIGTVALLHQAPLWVAQACWGVALFAVLWVGTLGTRLISQPFGMTFWAVSFPLAAFASLTLRLAHATGIAALQVGGMLALALASLVVMGLALATVRGLRNGSLLAPEPVASITPVTGSASRP